jgi:simple sugar transport system permease protein
MVFGNVGEFNESVISGRGFIAIAAVIFGGWTLKGTIAGCVVFAGALSFRLSIQGLGYQINSELLQSLPFLVTIIGMALFAHRVRAPGALARPFVRGLK